MRAVQYIAPGAARIVTVPDPGLPVGGLLLRTSLAAICGSDLHFLYDRPAHAYPAEPGFSGHECVAIVEEAAPSTGFSPEQRVLALAPDYDAFAEYLPAQPAAVIPVPDALDTEQALLAQQLGTVVFCCQKLSCVLNAHVAVVGQGPAGLLFTMLLSSMGAASVTAVDIVDHRLALASTLGASCAVQSEHAVSAVHAQTHGTMADIVVEAVGKPETINLCAALVCTGGEVALFGVPKSPRISVDLEHFMRKNARIITSVFAQREPGLRSFHSALALISSARINPRSLISHRLPFTSIVHGFALAESRRAGTVKVVLTF